MSGPDRTAEDVLRGMDDRDLAPRVATLLGADDVDVAAWSHEPLDGGVSELAGNAHFRLSGTARADGDPRSWSLVVKVHDLGDGETRIDRDSARETGFFESDLAPLECDGFRSVRAVDLQYRDDPPSCWLWLAALDDAFDDEWPLAQFERAARHLGRFNGRFAGAVPEYDWLDPYEFECGPAGPVVAALDELPDHSGLARAFPPETRDPFRRVWAARDRLLDRQRSLPATFCHFDPTPGNLFARETDEGWETVAIDWEFCGTGPLGADAALLVAASPVAGHADVECLPDLDDRVFDAYLAGLRDTGWGGDSDLVRAGYASTMLTHWLESTGNVRRPYLDPATEATFRELFGITRETWLERLGERARFLAGKVEEAFDALDAVE